MLAKVLLVVLLIGVSGFGLMFLITTFRELLNDESDYPDEL